MSPPTMLHRRQHLQALFAAGVLTPALLSIPGCVQPAEPPDGARAGDPDGPGGLDAQAFEDSCPENPEESGGVDWAPDILHPVFWGFRDLDVPDGAPGPLRIFFPTYDGSPHLAGILKLCIVRYPVVLFLHGKPGCTNTVDYYKHWNKIGMVLARSGYVVVVPRHDPTFPENDQSVQVDYALKVLDWVREGWEHREWVDQQPEATAIVGHSWGALLAARVRQARPTISAYVGLSGTWAELSVPQPVLAGVSPPSFFMWCPDSFEDLDTIGIGGIWGNVPFGKTRAVFGGRHFDYLSPSIWNCDVPHGGCTLIELVAAELVALFISRHVPGKLALANIPPSLIPPPVTLTPNQQFFAGSHLQGIVAIQTKSGCGIDLRWEDPDDMGSRHLGP